MTSANEYKLNCLVEGDTIVSPILISRDASIERLAKLIYEKGKNGLFRDIGPRDLILLKVKINLEPLRGHFSEFRLEHHHQPTKLDELSQLLSELWNEHPPARHLHVYVRLRSRDGDLRKAEKQIEELKREVEDLSGQPSLKRARDESTSVDDGWLRGWIQLGDSDPWKRFGDYWRKQNVETTRDRPSIAFAYEESGEDNPQYRLPLVPSTNNKIIVRDCYKGFYEHILYLRRQIITAIVLTGQPGTGKTLWLPYALIRLLTENETVAYHSRDGTFLFFENSVYSRISQETHFPPAKPATYCLIDSDGAKDLADIDFMTGRTKVFKTFPIIASSPNPSRYKNMRKQRTSIPVEVMPLWERDELKKGLEIQWWYNDLRQDVKTALSVDDGSIIPVSPKELKREAWHNLIISALEMIRDGDDSLDDATGDDAIDDGTDDAIDNAVDEVLDKILDNVIEAYGSSARDIYEAIVTPDIIQGRINEVVLSLKYRDLPEAVVRLQQVDATNNISHTIFSMRTTKPLGQAHLSSSPRFEVQFKSHWIKFMVLKHLEFLQDLDTAAMIKEMRKLPSASSYAGFMYEGFAAKVLVAGQPSSSLQLMKAEKGKTTFFLPDGPKDTSEESPFNRPRTRSYASFSTGPLALEFKTVDPKKNLADYFWIPMSPNSPLFDAFVIEFKDPAQGIGAVVWVLQMRLNKEHGGSPESYQLIKLIKTKAEEAMETMSSSHTKQQKCQKVNNVIVKYVLVSPNPGQWKLPKKNWRSYEGDVYYQCVDY